MEDDYLDDKIFQSYCHTVLKDILPNGFVRYISSLNDIPQYFELDESNSCLKNSDYYTNSVSDINLIHFTSIENFKNIISSNILRLYDLNFADDPNEVVFAAQQSKFGFTDEELISTKSNLFSCSFCKYPFSSNNEEYNLWRFYGNDGRGIGLVFKNVNDYEDWQDFHLSKIYYNDIERLSKLEKAIENHSAFIKELLAQKSLKPNKRTLLSRDLTKFLSFHKHSIFEIENEYRLLFYKRGYNISFSETNLKIFKTFNKNNKVSSFIELPLFNERNKVKKEPRLIIDKIILGFRFSEDERKDIEDVIRTIIVENYDHYEANFPEVTITNLKEKYFQ